MLSLFVRSVVDGAFIVALRASLFSLCIRIFTNCCFWRRTHEQVEREYAGLGWPVWAVAFIPT